MSLCGGEGEGCGTIRRNKSKEIRKFLDRDNYLYLSSQGVAKENDALSISLQVVATLDLLNDKVLIDNATQSELN